MSRERLVLALPAALVLTLGLACGGLGAPDSSAPAEADAADPSAASPEVREPEPSGPPATPRPDGLQDNLALTKDINTFPMLQGRPNPDFAEGDVILALAKLSAPAKDLVVADGEGAFEVVLHEDGRVLHRHAWTWPVGKFEANSPMLLMNLVPSKDMGGKGEDWTPGFARALDGLDGTHQLTFQLESPHADPSVVAIADFTYSSDGKGDYAAVAQDLEDFLEGKGKYKPKPRPAPASSGSGGGGSQTISTNLLNNCSDNAKVTMTAPDGSTSSVTIPATRVKTVKVQLGTRLAARSASDGSRLNQRLKALDRDFYDGMTSNLCR